MTRGTITTVLCAAGLFIGGPDVGRAAVADATLACQAAASRAGAVFVGATTRCVSACVRKHWKGRVPETDCFAPYGGATAACVRDAAPGNRGAEDRYGATILRACDPATEPGAECPSCYADGDCSASGYGTAQVRRMAERVAGFGAGVFCERAGAEVGEQKCQLATAKVLARLVGAVTACHDRCVKSVPAAADCGAPTAATRMSACMAKAEARAARQIDARCGGRPSGSAGARPDCGGVDAYPDGTAWARFVAAATFENVADAYCDVRRGRE